MHPTTYDDVNQVLIDLQAGLEAVLAENLAGLYLSGSLTYDGYTAGVSDIDLLAAVRHDLQPSAIGPLEKMHAGIVDRYPEWENRVEVVYLSLDALRTYKTKRSPIAVISPGEPLHFREELAGDDWLMNWYLVLAHGRTICGPPPAEIIAPATIDEFIAAIREHARAWGQWADNLDSAKYRSYAVLTMCRTLYSDRRRSHVSKQTAAEWVASQFPGYRELVNDALLVRAMNGEAAERSGKVPLAEARRFIAEIRRLLGVA